MKPDFTKITEYISKKGKTNIFFAAGIIGILLIFLGDIDFAEKEKISVSGDISLQQYKYDTEK